MRFPLSDWNGTIPTGEHPGSFGFVRKHHVHEGVDLYTEPNTPIRAIEDGHVVSIEHFTGPEAGSPWWLPTKAILVSGESGVFCYGEMQTLLFSPGSKVKAGECLGIVIPVLKPGKERPDIEGHSRFMLHLELYKAGTRKSVSWKPNQKQPENLLDPTQILIDIKQN